MERVFLEDHGRYKAGMVRDYDRNTWKTFFPGYERFTRPADEVQRAGIHAMQHQTAGRRGRRAQT